MLCHSAPTLFEMLGLLSETGDDSDSFSDLLADSDDFSSSPGVLKIHSSSLAIPARSLSESGHRQPVSYDQSSDYALILDDSDSEDCSQLDGKCETAFSRVTPVRNKGLLGRGAILRPSADEESLKAAQ